MSRRGWRHTWLRRSVATLFLAALVLGARGGSSWLRGSTAATTAFDLVPFTDPLAALEVTLAGRHAVSETWLGAGLLVLAGALLGAVFCGWLCPLGLALDVNDALRRRVRRWLRRRGLDLPDPRVPSGLRLLTLGAVVGFALFTALPVFQALSPIHLLVRAAVFAMSGGLVAVALLMVVEWIVPRLWCRALCPAGALYAVIGRLAPFRVRIDPELAGEYPCRMCTLHCPMGIRVMEDHVLAGKESVDDPDCTRCGSCVDACPRSTLRLGFAARAHESRARRTRPSSSTTENGFISRSTSSSRSLRRDSASSV